MVVGNLDERVRSDSARFGTVIFVNRDDVLVLLSNGDLWKGHRRDVVLQNQQDSNQNE